MRKKKKALGASLNLQPTATNIESQPTDSQKELAKYEILFGDVMANFENKQSEFEQLKKMSREELIVYDKEVKIENIPQDWRRSLEMQVPESKPGEHCHDSNLSHFNHTK